jgi:RNA polymerase sigma-70 factor (ECF subfamily)
MTWTDEELVARSIGGDVDSFNQLILRWERPIFALAYRVIGREEDARDVCQETFLRAFRALPGFKGQAKFSSWLYRIALNLCRDWIRRQRRAPVMQAPEGVDLVDLVSEQGPSESVEELVARQELSAIVEQAMTLLPEEQRTAIILKEYHGMTFQEIADLQGCPLSTVKTRLYQGLVVLRRHLEKNEKAAPELVKHV